VLYCKGSGVSGVNWHAPHIRFAGRIPIIIADNNIYASLEGIDRSGDVAAIRILHHRRCNKNSGAGHIFHNIADNVDVT
jgi:hypothetical protein